jgi:hypothetical protein
LSRKDTEYDGQQTGHGYLPHALMLPQDSQEVKSDSGTASSIFNPPSSILALKTSDVTQDPAYHPVEDPGHHPPEDGPNALANALARDPAKGLA